MTRKLNTLSTLILILLSSTIGFSQVMTNKGDTLTVKDGSTFYIGGGYDNLNNGPNQAYNLNNGKMYVTGNVTATSNTIYTGLDTFYLYGTGAQNFAPFTFNYLIVPNGGYKYLTGGNSHILNNAWLQDGVIKTNTDTLILVSSGMLNESTLGYVRGNTKSTKTLPVATPITFGQNLVITRNGSTNPGNVSVTRISDSNQIGSPVLKRKNTSGGPYQWAETKYLIEPDINGGLDVDITFKYHDSLLMNCDESALNIFRKPSGSSTFWYMGKESHNTTTNTIADLNCDSFSEWILGGATSPLPVELLYFDAKLMSPTTSLISWETVTELNNDYFIVERSLDMKSWSFIERKQGAGTIYTPQYYQTWDKTLGTINQNVVYYRLKQVDYDGTNTYSEIKKLYLNKQANNQIVKAWFNPKTDKVHIMVENPDSRDFKLTLYSTEGKLLHTAKHTLTDNQNQIEVDYSTFAAGMYLYQLDDGKNPFTGRIVKSLAK